MLFHFYCVFSHSHSLHIQQQSIFLRNSKNVDALLRQVSSLLDATDLQVVTKKLNDLMESHHTRAFMRRRAVKPDTVSALAEQKGREFGELYAGSTSTLQ